MSNHNESNGALPVHRLTLDRPRLGLKNMAELTMLIPTDDQGLHSLRIQAPREIMAELLWTLETFTIRHQFGSYSPEQQIGSIRAYPQASVPSFLDPHIYGTEDLATDPTNVTDRGLFRLRNERPRLRFRSDQGTTDGREGVIPPKLVHRLVFRTMVTQAMDYATTWGITTDYLLPGMDRSTARIQADSHQGSSGTALYSSANLKRIHSAREHSVRFKDPISTTAPDTERTTRGPPIPPRGINTFLSNYAGAATAAPSMMYNAAASVASSRIVGFAVPCVDTAPTSLKCHYHAQPRGSPCFCFYFTAATFYKQYRR